MVDVPYLLWNWQIFEKPTDPVAAVHYNEGKLTELQMDHQKDAKTVDLKALQTDCREQVDVGQWYEVYR